MNQVQEISAEKKKTVRITNCDDISATRPKSCHKPIDQDSSSAPDRKRNAIKADVSTLR